MNVLFLNSFERQDETGAGSGGCLTVSEKAGEFYVGWNQCEAPGQMWYQGGSWDDAIAALRIGLLGRLKDGWTPLFNVLETIGAETQPRAGRRTLQLQYYAEKHRNDELYEKLRVWRRSAAGKQGVAPFIVASNRTLAMISAFVPRTAEELKQIPGFGENRTKQHAEAVLQLTEGYPRETEFPLDWIGDVVDNGQLDTWLQEQRLTKETSEQEKKARRRMLLERIACGDSIGELAERLAVDRREVVRGLEELDREGYDMEPVIARELSGVPEEEIRKAAALMDELSDRYLKPVVEKLYTPEERASIGLDIVYERVRLLRMRLRREKETGQPQAG